MRGRGKNQALHPVGREDGGGNEGKQKTKGFTEVWSLKTANGVSRSSQEREDFVETEGTRIQNLRMQR